MFKMQILKLAIVVSTFCFLVFLKGKSLWKIMATIIFLLFVLWPLFLARKVPAEFSEPGSNEHATRRNDGHQKSI